MLTTRRRELHHHVAVTLERLYADRLDEHYGQLAYHFFEAGEEIDKTIDYAVRAGDRDMTLLAYAEAMRFYHMALQTLERQAVRDETRRYTLCLALGEAQRKAGEHEEALKTLQQAFHSARQLDGDPITTGRPRAR